MLGFYYYSTDKIIRIMFIVNVTVNLQYNCWICSSTNQNSTGCRLYALSPPPAKCIQRHTIISSVLSCRDVMRLSAVIVGRHVSNSISGRTTDQRHGSYEVASGTGRRGVDTGQVDVDRL